MIENIKQGMTAAQVFDILNRLINEHNQMMTALGETLVDGKLNYNALANKPTINSVELSGDLTQEDLEISTDATLADELRRVENTLNQKVSAERLTTTLQSYAKTTDLPDVSGLATKEELTQGLSEKVARRDYDSTVASINTAVNSKADAGEVPTVTQWQVLRSEMENKVTQAGNSASSAASAATEAVAEAIRNLPENTTIQAIVSKLNEIVTRSNTISASECGSAPIVRCLDPVQQLVINS